MNKVGRPQIEQWKQDQITARLARGETNKQIARDLGVGTATVSRYRQLSVPQNTAAPASGGRVVALELGHEQAMRLSEGANTKLIAGELMYDSLRIRLLKAIASESTVDDVETLIKLVRTGSNDAGTDPHNVVHLLWTLNKAGYIAFRENKSRKSGAQNAHLERIRVTPRGLEAAGMTPTNRPVVSGYHGARHRGGELPQHRSDGTDFRNHGSKAQGSAVERIRAVQPETVITTVFPSRKAAEETFEAAKELVATMDEEPTLTRMWPQLQALRERQAELAARSARVDALMEAAAALDGVDPDAAKLLLARAEATDGQPLTELEREYLAFAELASKL
jgi:hypothetical protein